MLPAATRRRGAFGTTPVAKAIGVALAVASGVTVAIQSRINGQLATELRDGIAAAAVSFGTGLLLLVVLVPALPAGRRRLRAVREALHVGSLRPWHCLGGLGGALLVASQGLTVTALGVAVFTVALVAGQSASSLAVDRAGVGPGGVRPVTLTRLAGAALTVVAVLVAIGDRLGSPRSLGLAALPALAGVAVAWQQAVNGRVRQVAGAALPAAFVNFIAGAAALLVAFAVDVALRGWPAGALPGRPLLYLGGIVGVIYIAVLAAVVRLIGVLLLALAVIAGQVVGALLIDKVAPGLAGPPGWNTLLGGALAMVAVAVAALPDSSSARRATLRRG